MLSRGLAAVLAVIVCGGALNWGHAGGDDQDCSPGFFHHDHAAHRFSASPSHSPRTVDHCYICHTLRLLHSSLIARGARAALTVQCTPFRRVDALAALSGSGLALSSRAPPSVHL
jgi:hypothetical protein